MALKKYDVVLEEKELKKFDERARADERSRSFLLRKAIQDFLNREVAKRENVTS